jgi:hypothetical protein
MPPKKCTPFSCAVNGAIAWKLLTGLILENTPQGVDSIFSLALSTYHDLKDDGKWEAAMRPTPGGAGAAPNGGFMAAEQITGPFC